MVLSNRCYCCCCCCCSYRPSLLYRNTVYSYGLFVRYHAIVSLAVCFIVLMKMNDVKQTSRRKNQIINMPYINTVYRTTQYNLYILQKYVKTIQFLNCDEQFLKKNKKNGKFKKLVRKTAFSKNSKILHRP